MKKRDSQHNLESIRSSGIAKKAKFQNYVAGRFNAHLKLEDMRHEV
jgi:hypothetical protein